MRIPKEFRFACDEVLIEREGERVILTPRPKSWRDYFARASRFSDDFPDTTCCLSQKRYSAIIVVIRSGVEREEGCPSSPLREKKH